VGEGAAVATGQRVAAKQLAYAMARATVAVLSTFVLTGDDATPDIELQAEQRLNPTKSSHAYQHGECIDFANDAVVYFAKMHKDAKKIKYRSVPGRTVGSMGGNICAAPGFGFFGAAGGQNISINGYHEGALVDGLVYDNNVPFGVPRRMWENGYEVKPIDRIGYLTLFSADKLLYGNIWVE
jgi:hypothetical protein